MQTLNARRRRAVQLRVDGHSLSQISTQTGLSVPTILSAVRAFEAGGWHAIDVGSRGRPRGDGRTLSATQERFLREAALGQVPERHALPAGTWTAQAVAHLAQRQFSVSLSPRALARLLERWGLAMQALPDIATTPDQQQWLTQQWTPALAPARDQGRRLLWGGALAHPDVPGGGVLVAITPRGSLHWLGVRPLHAWPVYQDFFTRLLADNTQSWTLWLHGPALAQVPAARQWLAQQPRLRVLSSPLAPRPRCQPEALMPPPVVSSSFAVPATAESAPLACAQTPAPAPSAAVALTPRSSLFNKEGSMNLTHLQRLEAESIHIMREVVAEADNPVMLYSIGKDSAVMLHLAKKAFYPAPPPFPLLHVDTTWKFRAMYEMRDRMANELGMDLLVHHNPEAVSMGINPFDHGSQIHTDMWKTQGLKQALDKYHFDVAFGGARRDEEKSRAKERIFSFRSAQHRWDPKNQRPELWHLYNGRKHKGESIRCFPISNWTELDIWQYIYLENVPIVPLYFAAPRPVVDRDGTLIMVDDDRFPLRPGEVPMMKSVRFRTLGCYPLSGAVESTAGTLKDIIQEMLLTKTSERQGRMIDHDSAASMEKKKQEGYF
jgi:sulfate adenylyltransferase subunit 2